MKLNLFVGTTLIPFLALSVVSLLYIFLPVSANLLTFVKNSTLNNIGFLTTVFGISYAIGLIIWGGIADHLGKDTTLAIGLLLLAIISSIIAFMTDYYLLLLARAVQGFCAAAFPPVALAWISINLPDTIKNQAISIISCAFLLAANIGQWFGSLMITDNLYLIMWTLTLSYLLGAICFYYYRKKNKYRNSIMTKSSITIMISQLPKLLLNKQRFAIYFCSLFVLLSFVALYSVLHQSWLSVYISELRNISIFTLLFSLTASFVYKKISPLYVLVTALCLMAISLAMHAFYLNNQQNPIYLLLMIHFVFILGLAYAVPSMITCIAMNSSIQNRGMATSLYTSILFIGASLGAVLPTMFNSNILIVFMVFFLIFNAVQLILSFKNRTYQ